MGQMRSTSWRPSCVPVDLIHLNLDRLVKSRGLPLSMILFLPLRSVLVARPLNMTVHTIGQIASSDIILLAVLKAYGKLTGGQYVSASNCKLYLSLNRTIPARS